MDTPTAGGLSSTTRPLTVGPNPPPTSTNDVTSIAAAAGSPYGIDTHSDSGSDSDGSSSTGSSSSRSTSSRSRSGSEGANHVGASVSGSSLSELSDDDSLSDSGSSDLEDIHNATFGAAVDGGAGGRHSLTGGVQSPGSSVSFGGYSMMGFDPQAMMLAQQQQHQIMVPSLLFSPTPTADGVAAPATYSARSFGSVSNAAAAPGGHITMATFGVGGVVAPGSSESIFSYRSQGSGRHRSSSLREDSHQPLQPHHHRGGPRSGGDVYGDAATAGYELPPSSSSSASSALSARVARRAAVTLDPTSAAATTTAIGGDGDGNDGGHSVWAHLGHPAAPSGTEYDDAEGGGGVDQYAAHQCASGGVTTGGAGGNGGLSVGIITARARQERGNTYTSSSSGDGQFAYLATSAPTASAAAEALTSLGFSALTSAAAAMDVPPMHIQGMTEPPGSDAMQRTSSFSAEMTMPPSATSTSASQSLMPPPSSPYASVSHAAAPGVTGSSFPTRTSSMSSAIDYGAMAPQFSSGGGGGENASHGVYHASTSSSSPLRVEQRGRRPVSRNDSGGGAGGRSRDSSTSSGGSSTTSSGSSSEAASSPFPLQPLQLQPQRQDSLAIDSSHSGGSSGAASTIVVGGRAAGAGKGPAFFLMRTSIIEEDAAAAAAAAAEARKLKRQLARDRSSSGGGRKKKKKLKKAAKKSKGGRGRSSHSSSGAGAPLDTLTAVPVEAGEEVALTPAQLDTLLMPPPPPPASSHRRTKTGASSSSSSSGGGSANGGSYFGGLVGGPNSSYSLRGSAATMYAPSSATAAAVAAASANGSSTSRHSGSSSSSRAIAASIAVVRATGRGKGGSGSLLRLVPSRLSSSSSMAGVSGASDSNNRSGKGVRSSSRAPSHVYSQAPSSSYAHAFSSVLSYTSAYPLLGHPNDDEDVEQPAFLITALSHADAEVRRAASLIHAQGRLIELRMSLVAAEQAALAGTQR